MLDRVAHLVGTVIASVAAILVLTATAAAGAAVIVYLLSLAVR